MTNFLAILIVALFVANASQAKRTIAKASFDEREGGPQQHLLTTEEHALILWRGPVILAEESENGHWFWQTDWPQLIFWGALIFIGGGALAKKTKKSKE